VLFQKTAPYALVFLLVLVLSPFVVADDNPLPTEQQHLPVDPAVVWVVLGCIAIFAVVWIAVKIAIIVFVYRDAQARGAEAMLWLILCLFTDLIGLIIWLNVRPPLKEPQ
jgi:hypothetical protein